MITLILGLLLLHPSPQGVGVVTGVVRGSNGSLAPGVRVYAITYRDAVEAANVPPALEGLTETDESGRYRLELPPGRYHIATGSVLSPTYYPNTADISAARIISVARDLVEQNIDFGTFVPAAAGFGGIPPGNGVLSGVIRYPDGSPASGVRVVASPMGAPGTVSVSFVTPTTGGLTVLNTVVVAGNQIAVQLQNPNILFATRGGSQAVTDVSGAYQIQSLGPETYQILAGYADAPVFYPGTTDVSASKTVVLALNAKVDKLDFTVPSRPAGVAVSGTVSTTSGLPVSLAKVQLRMRDTFRPPGAAISLPLRSPPQTIDVAADGSFSFPDVLPGVMVVEVTYPGISNKAEEVVVSGQPVNGLQVVLPVTRVSGRIVMEDGSAVPNPEVFDEAILAAVGKPNMLASTPMPISRTGTFSRLLEPGDFRFHVGLLPEEYEIKSAKVGSADLLRETLKISGKDPVDLEIRLARRSAVLGATRVSGTLRDSITGVPSSGRLILCCVSSGIAEKYSAPLGADGSFEFSGLPPGTYTPSLYLPLGVPAGNYITGSVMDVGPQGLQGAALFTAAQFGPVSATIQSEDANPLSENVSPSIVFVNPVSGLRVVADRNAAGDHIAMLPRGTQYNVTVEDLPEGFVVKKSPEPVNPGLQLPVSVTIGRAEPAR